MKLYVYLTRQLADDEANSEIISDFRREMAKIGRVVMEFLRKYTEQPFDTTNMDEFKNELDGIGAALTARIEREEGVLYTLYMPSYR